MHDYKLDAVLKASKAAMDTELNTLSFGPDLRASILAQVAAAAETQASPSRLKRRWVPALVLIGSVAAAIAVLVVHREPLHKPMAAHGPGASPASPVEQRGRADVAPKMGISAGAPEGTMDKRAGVAAAPDAQGSKPTMVTEAEALGIVKQMGPESSWKVTFVAAHQATQSTADGLRQDHWVAESEKGEKVWIDAYSGEISRLPIVD